MKNVELRNALSKAEMAYNKAEMAIQYFAGMLVFAGFNSIEPIVGYISDGILITYENEELYAEQAIELMEEKGCITPDDFTDTMRFKKR